MAEHDMSHEMNDHLLRLTASVNTLLERSDNTKDKLKDIEARLVEVERSMASFGKEMGKYSVVAAVVIAAIVFIVQQALRIAGG
jgi:hypothetical protein